MAFLAALTTAGCSPTGVEIRGQLPPCSPMGTLAVEELSAYTDCSLEGWTLVFPDSETFVVGSANGSASTTEHPGLEWGASNWGGDGTVAWRRTNDGMTFWGPRAAIDREVLLLSRDLD
ncbi:hypothetical protein [Cellulomonas fimi]|uniref:Uncharacterized protein n=1 Tax=Cellulomonas fimi TaxID=1708 RepID=A0A7Y0QG33_CELFI|nr:hypothetical protein [Cellulomonas fimi]NMR18825.1 hypothetical protein [Cellulomonas fimi]